MEKLNQWLSLLANFGVLLGIVFLAIELNQNTNMTRAQTRDSMTEKQLAFYSQVMADSDAAIAWESAGTDPSEIDGPFLNEVRLNYFLLTQLRMWENELYQYRQGLFETNEFQSRLALWENLMSGRGGRSIARRTTWESQQFSFSEDFRAVLNELISLN